MRRALRMPELEKLESVITKHISPDKLLRHACEFGNQHKALVALRAGADVDLADCHGLFPEDYATMYGHRDLVRLVKSWRVNHSSTDHGVEVEYPIWSPPATDY